MTTRVCRRHHHRCRRLLARSAAPAVHHREPRMPFDGNPQQLRYGRQLRIIAGVSSSARLVDPPLPARGARGDRNGTERTARGCEAGRCKRSGVEVSPGGPGPATLRDASQHPQPPPTRLAPRVPRRGIRSSPPNAALRPGCPPRRTSPRRAWVQHDARERRRGHVPWLPGVATADLPTAHTTAVATPPQRRRARRGGIRSAAAGAIRSAHTRRSTPTQAQVRRELCSVFQLAWAWPWGRSCYMRQGNIAF